MTHLPDLLADLDNTLCYRTISLQEVPSYLFLMAMLNTTLQFWLVHSSPAQRITSTFWLKDNVTQRTNHATIVQKYPNRKETKIGFQD